jgi:hypothetical protein
LGEVLAAGAGSVIIEKKGQEGIQEGFDVLRKGISAKKVIVVAN